jgi:hypothetical protein
MTHYIFVDTLFWTKRKHRDTSERVTSEPRLGSPVRFELDRCGAQSEVLAKNGVSVMEIGPTSTQAASGRGKAMPWLTRELAAPEMSKRRKRNLR